MGFELTKEEKNAINILKRLEERWPESLWLFSASGSLHVMRVGDDGEHVTADFGGMDPNYIIATINIDNDGGDW